MKQQITMHFSRETKGALLYREPASDLGDPNYLIGNIYLRKAAIEGESWPRKITITVTTEEPNES